MIQDIDGDSIPDCTFFENQCLQIDSSCETNSGNDFYIDLISPSASLSISQNELSPDLMDLYIVFDETLSTHLDSEIFIKNITENSDGEGYNLIDGSDNVYRLLRPFPGLVLYNLM